MSEYEIRDLGVVQPGSVVNITSKSPDDLRREVVQRVQAQIAAKVGHDDFVVVVTMPPASVSLDDEVRVPRAEWEAFIAWRAMGGGA